MKINICNEELEINWSYLFPALGAFFITAIIAYIPAYIESELIFSTENYAPMLTLIAQYLKLFVPTFIIPLTAAVSLILLKGTKHNEIDEKNLKSLAANILITIVAIELVIRSIYSIVIMLTPGTVQVPIFGIEIIVRIMNWMINAVMIYLWLKLFNGKRINANLILVSLVYAILVLISQKIIDALIIGSLMGSLVFSASIYSEDVAVLIYALITATAVIAYIKEKDVDKLILILAGLHIMTKIVIELLTAIFTPNTFVPMSSALTIIEKIVFWGLLIKLPEIIQELMRQKSDA